MALAEQHDLAGAERQLRRALELDPELVDERVLLARVLADEGEREEGLQEARQAVAQAPRAPTAHSALGQLLWQQGQLAEAAQSYRQALALSPGSAAARIELARVYLDQNNVPNALSQALQAVDLAAGSSEAHAILGLVYDRSDNSEQAVREYREAIGLSPKSALARVGLALQSGRAEDEFFEFGQALLRDPAVLQQQLKPGVTTQLSLDGGSQALYEQGFKHRDQYAGGRLYDLSFGVNSHDDGWRGNDERIDRLAYVGLAARPTPRLTTLYQLRYDARHLGLPGLSFQPDRDDSHYTRLVGNSVAGRYELTARSSLWLQAADENLHQNHANPDGPNDGRLRLEDHTRSGSTGFELRLDHHVGRTETLTYGYFHGNDATESSDRTWDESFRAAIPGSLALHLRDEVQYLQLEHQAGSLSLVAGAQYARSRDRATLREYEPDFTRVSSTDNGSHRWLPYGAATLQVAPRTALRLIGYERSTRLDTAVLLPTEAFITADLPDVGFNGQTKTFELDLEHRFSPRLFTRLFLFRNDVRNLQIAGPEYVSQPNLTFLIPQARLDGIGLRLERQLTPFLAGYLRWSSGSATDRTQGPTHGWQLPRFPHSTVLLGLNFVDRAGTKAFLEAAYNSRVYSESLWSGTQGFDPLQPRPQEPPRLLLNLRLGRERSVRQEWVFRVNNLFNHAYSLWPGLPARGRTVSLELRWRFYHEKCHRYER